MENFAHLQCKALRSREKRRGAKNNGKQWENNAKNNETMRDPAECLRSVVTPDDRRCRCAREAAKMRSLRSLDFLALFCADVAAPVRSLAPP
jgi:hypothetical protein